MVVCHAPWRLPRTHITRAAREERDSMNKRVLAGALALAITTDAFARTFINAHVTTIRLDANGFGMVFFDVTASGAPPPCVHPDYANALAIDTNTAGGKAILVS